VFVTRHTNVVDAALAAKLWHLYEVGYAGMPEQAVTREVLYRTEFDAAIADPTNRLWVLWDDTAPVGMVLVATDIAATRYLSRAYFEHHYPEHMRRGAVHYIMWLVVHPAHTAKGSLIRLAKEGMALEAADGALLVFDSPEIHQSSLEGGFAEIATRSARSVAGPAPVHHLETQHYFAIDFAALHEPVEPFAASSAAPPTPEPSRR
jgi:hypothetical protein